MNESNLRRGVMQMLAIVGSILLAFAIDAAWDVRQESREEELLLGSLQTEFQFTRTELLRHQARWARARSASARLLQLAGAGTTAPPATMDSLLSDFMTPTSYDPRSGTLNAVLVSGGLQLIGNRELRSFLAGWPGVVEELRDNELAMREFILFAITPYLAKNAVPLGRAQALIPGSGLRGGGEPGGGWPSELRSDEEADRLYRNLIQDPEFEVLLGTRYTWINVEEYQEAIEYVDELLDVLAAELD